MESKSEMETLDNLLESIAFENFTTNIHLDELMNGDTGKSKVILTSNNTHINQKTDTLNRYFDNLISFNREIEKANTRKSESSSDHSSSSDQQNNNGRLPFQQVRPHPYISLSVSSSCGQDLFLMIIFFTSVGHLVHEIVYPKLIKNN